MESLASQAVDLRVAAIIAIHNCLERCVLDEGSLAESIIVGDYTSATGHRHNDDIGGIGEPSTIEPVVETVSVSFAEDEPSSNLPDGCGSQNVF